MVLAQPFAGDWTYRSFDSNPKHIPSWDDLKYGEGTLRIDAAPFGVFAGELSLQTGASLTLNGTVSHGYPQMLQYRGTGIGPKAAGWIYDYTGFLVPQWLNGVDQRPAIIGTLVRTNPHNGQAAGYVACFIAVWQG